MFVKNRHCQTYKLPFLNLFIKFIKRTNGNYRPITNTYNNKTKFQAVVRSSDWIPLCSLAYLFRPCSVQDIIIGLRPACQDAWWEAFICESPYKIQDGRCRHLGFRNCCNFFIIGPIIAKFGGNFWLHSKHIYDVKIPIDQNSRWRLLPYWMVKTHNLLTLWQINAEFGINAATPLKKTSITSKMLKVTQNQR